jgi:hypothetical protein
MSNLPVFHCLPPRLDAGCKAKVRHILLMMMWRRCPNRVMLVGRWPQDRLGQCKVQYCSWPWLVWCHTPSNCPPHLVHPRKQVWGQHVLHQGTGCDLGRILRQPVPGQACVCRRTGHHVPSQQEHMQLLLQTIIAAYFLLEVVSVAKYHWTPFVRR